MDRIDRTGERRLMNCGLWAEIIEYKNSRNVTVKLEDGTIKNTTYQVFKNGGIKSRFVPTVYGVGIIGEEQIIESKGCHCKAYKVWQSMLQRCYDTKYQEKKPTYKGCSVCDEWLYFPNFKKWFNENYYTIEGEEIHLDKDILVKGNKLYSPETCIFVPKHINSLFSKKSNNDLPEGVYYDKRNKKYCSSIFINYKRKFLGRFDTIEKAENIYNEFKKKEIKRIADKYYVNIPNKLYNRLIEISEGYW